MINTFYFQTIRALRLSVIVVALLWFGVFAVPADDHYVSPPGGHGTNNYPYTSWADAATNIQWAVDAASPGETVWVTNGAYCVTNQITITNGITLMSMHGYSNTLVYADWPAYATRCLYASNICVVDGFTFSNGHAYGAAPHDGGGGAYVTRTVVVQNCYFVNNIASNTPAESGGGGINAQYRSIVSNCLVFSNTAYYVGISETGCGGGMLLREAKALNCTVISNFAGRRGGGIYSPAEWSAAFYIYNTISNCVISYNSGYYGGGVFNGHGEIVDCVITYNSAIVGGGIHNATLTRNCVISNNYAPAGGGIYNVHIHPGVFASNCVIVANKSGGSIDYKGGGGAYVGAGFLRECKIYNNISTSCWGGGGALLTNNGSLINCLIYNNTNTATNGNGGGVFLANASLTGGCSIINCTIANNYSTNEGGGIAALGPSNLIVNSIIAGNRSFSNLFPDVYNTGANSNNYYYCCATNVLFAPNRGNITRDSFFADAGAGNWQLNGNSPCVNAGTNQSWMTNSFDLNGRVRIRYGVVDMGAYETVYEGMISVFR